MEIRNKNLPGCCACSIKPWRAWKGIKGKNLQLTCTWITNQGQIILLSRVSTRRFYTANQLVMLRHKVYELTKHLQSTQWIWQELSVYKSPDPNPSVKGNKNPNLNLLYSNRSWATSNHSARNIRHIVQTLIDWGLRWCYTRRFATTIFSAT